MTQIPQIPWIVSREWKKRKMNGEDKKETNFTFHSLVNCDPHSETDRVRARKMLTCWLLFLGIFRAASKQARISGIFSPSLSHWSSHLTWFGSGRHLKLQTVFFRFPHIMHMPARRVNKFMNVTWIFWPLPDTKWTFNEGHVGFFAHEKIL